MGAGTGACNCVSILPFPQVVVVVVVVVVSGVSGAGSTRPVLVKPHRLLA